MRPKTRENVVLKTTTITNSFFFHAPQSCLDDLEEVGNSEVNVFVLVINVHFLRVADAKDATDGRNL
jgi:hypothetical protein